MLPSGTVSALTLEERETIRRVIQFEGLPYNPSLDAKIAEHYIAHGKASPDVHEALAKRIHDHAIDDALQRFAPWKDGSSAKILGVMGSHRTARDTDGDYSVIARIARNLAGAASSLLRAADRE
jgi:hypothetical protein